MKPRLRLLALALALIACSSHPDPAVTRAAAPITDCYVAPPVGNIVGFGVNGQPRQWGSDGRAVKPALDMLVNDLGADFFRVEVNNGETDWESTNDDASPATFNWAAFDADFSTPAMLDTWDYIRYLNQLGVAHVELAQHGGLPAWMGPVWPYDGRAHDLSTAQEDEWVETTVALLLYARTRAPEPRPHFDLFSPFNEPEFSPPEGFKIDPVAQGARIIRKLVDRMNALPELAGIQIVVSDSANEPGMITFRQAIQSDAVIQARLAATSFHRYSDADTWATWNNASPPVWLSEFNAPSPGGNCFQTTWTQGLQAAGNLISALQNGVTAGLAWSDVDGPHVHQFDEWQSWGLLATTYQGSSNLCGAFGGTQPSDSALDAMTYAPKPTYLALRHGFKWIRPGATPLTASDNSGSVDLVAYKNGDSTVAVFGRNTGSTATVTVTLTMPNPPAYLTPRITTATSTDVVGSPVALAGGVGVFSLPGGSVFTLLSSPGTGSGGTGGSGGQGGMSSGGNAGSGGQSAGNGGVSGDGTAGASSGATSGGQSGSSGSNAGGQSGAGGAASGAGGQGFGGAGQGGAGTSSGGAGAGGAAAGMAGAGGSGGTGLPSLVAGWAFNEGSGTATADASGHGHTGTLVNGPTWTTTGCKYGSCLSFDGANDRVTTPDANDLDLNQTFTLMAWVLPTSVGATVWRPVMIKEEAGGLVYLLYASTKSGWLDIGGSDLDVTASGSLSTTAFSHVAFERNGGTMTYWLNGAQVASRTISGNTTASTGLLAIGGHSFWGGEWFAGKIDDVRIYSAALTGAQIATAMGAGL